MPWSHTSARTTFSFTYVIYADLGLSGGLHEGAVVELPGHVEALVLADDALVLQVALVADEHHGHVLGVLDPEDLLPEVLQVVEGGLGGDAVDQHEALPVLHVQVPHRCELLLEKKLQLLVDFYLF